MKKQFLQSQTSVCQLCDFIAIRRSTRRTAPSQKNRLRAFTSTPRSFIKRQQTFPKSEARIPLPARNEGSIRVSSSIEARKHRQIDKDLQEAIHLRNETLSSSSIPSEEDIKKILARCEILAGELVDPQPEQAELGIKGGSAASALLSIDEPPITTTPKKSHKFSAVTQKYVDQISEVAYTTLLHPAVFITPDVLQRYVELQSRLRKPDTFPEIFKLYSSKPIPEKGSSPIKYRQQNPNKVSNAVSSFVADRALQTAISAKSLVVAMDIIETTYATKAFRRDKFVRKGLLPVTGLAVAPVAAYAVASQLSMYQTTMDPAMATNVAFAGILAYMGFTATIGVVAVTTANDQMDRVTWAQGMPLRERWIREQERAATDKIAGAWGFRETWRRGEEEGEEWDALREWIGRKGMILDRVELMEGME